MQAAITQVKEKLNRRRFIKRSAAAAGSLLTWPYLVRGSISADRSSILPGSRITMGFIGVGNMGTGHLRYMVNYPDVQVVAVCDVNKNHRDRAAGIVNQKYGNKDCETYNDFRRLAAREDIDAVLIATPDHWHVLTALAAVKAGKAVYLEKPMGLTIAEDQALREAAGRYGTVFQFGTQQRSSRDFRFACELVRNERIGRLKRINVWCHGNPAGGSAKPVPVPEGLDYDMWLGQAPYVPYTTGRHTRNIWYHTSDYALGNITSWGTHMMDIALWGGAERLTGPVEIEGTGIFPTGGVRDCATYWDVLLTYAGGVEVNFMADEFHKVPPAKWRKRYGRTTYHGTAFEGTDGWVHVDRDGINAYPRSLLTTVIGPDEVHLPESPGHHRDFLDAVKTGKQTICPIDGAVQADIICQLCDIAAKVRQELKWDLTGERFVGRTVAGRLVSRAMRGPWRL